MENNSFCILIICILLSCHCKALDTRPNARCFKRLLVSLIFYIFFDLLCGLQENRVLNPAPWVVGVMNVLFFFSSAVVSFQGFLYAEAEFGGKWFHDRRKWFLYTLPLLILAVSLPFTLWGKYYFYIDEHSRYVRGSQYPILLVLCYGYLVVIGIHSLQKLLNKENYAHRSEYWAIASFVVFPLLSGALQTVYTGISIICMGATVACVQIFVSLQQAKITIDPLTQINNRSKMIQHLEKCISHQKSGGDRTLALFMIDINDFKQINDRFGHLEGDAALIMLAEVLKQVGARYKGQISRYGGDEFFVILQARGDEEVQKFRQDLLDTLNAYNEASGKPYSLSIGIGLAYYDPALSIPELIESADQALYSNKRKSKQGEKARLYFR